MTRKQARELMMKVLYQMDMADDFAEGSLDHYIGEEDPAGQREYCDALVRAICEHKAEIDQAISRYSVKWKIDRMPKTDISILRLSAGEILYMDDIPDAVTINEAVELAKKYGTDQSPSFVNAILGNIHREKTNE